jgi:hypothetical protein
MRARGFPRLIENCWRGVKQYCTKTQYNVIHFARPKTVIQENPVSEAAHLVQYIVVPYRAAADGVAPGEIRAASSEFGAIRIANSMASKFAGVAAYEVLVGKETGDMESPRILAQIGTVPALDD